MDEKEVIALKKLYRHHIRQLRNPNIFLVRLLNDNVFPPEYSNALKGDIKRGNSELLLKQIVKDLPKYCSAAKFAEFLKQHYRSLHRRFEKRLKRSTCVNRVVHVVPRSHYPSNRNNRLIHEFYEHIKSRALLDGNLHLKHELNDWSERMIRSLECKQLSPLCEKTKVADCAFVLLDLIAVLEKQHERNKSILWNSRVYDNMEKVLVHTSDPTLSRLIYYGRKGTALAHARHQDAMAYAQSVLESSYLFTRGRQIGNSIFAVVNIYLQKYASLDPAELRSSSGEKFKKEILYWIDMAIGHFEDEDDEVRKTWRRVYLDKKIFCYLGIDILSQDILDVSITREDMAAAKQSIDELESLRDGMESLRRVHLNVARGKLHAIRGERYVSEGYYKEALEIAKKYKFNAEVNVISHRICPTQPEDIAEESKLEVLRPGLCFTRREPSESSDVEMANNDKQLISDTHGKETCIDSCSALDTKDFARTLSLRPFQNVHGQEDEHLKKTDPPDGDEMVKVCIESITEKLNNLKLPISGGPVQHEEQIDD